MNVYLGQVAVLKYAKIQLEATNALVTLATHFLSTTKHAVVGGIFTYTCRSLDCWSNHSTWSFTLRRLLIVDSFA